MAENSKIQWTHHTFNPWRGCVRVSPGCVHCYAESLSKRNPKTLGVWGVEGTRVIASEAMWKKPRRWDDAAREAGERHRVFCASLADVGEDRSDLVAPRKRLQTLIWLTPHLDWLLLTKRPENMTRLFDREVLEQCWIGTTAEDQQRADERIPHLLGTPAKVRFISAEPLLGPLELYRYLSHVPGGGLNPEWDRNQLDWVIVGVEQLQGGTVGRNGNDYRVHARSVLTQCAYGKTAAFHKQMPVGGKVSGEPHEWSSEFRVRQFPKISSQLETHG